jgi:hypothetical protein
MWIKLGRALAGDRHAALMPYISHEPAHVAGLWRMLEFIVKIFKIRNDNAARFNGAS